MKKLTLLALVSVFVFVGCSAKEFNAGVDSITGDISKKIDSGVDKSERPK